MLWRNLQTVVLPRDSFLAPLRGFDGLSESTRLRSDFFESHSDFPKNFSDCGSDKIEKPGIIYLRGLSLQFSVNLRLPFLEKESMQSFNYTNYADDRALLTNTLDQAESRLHSL